MTEQKKTLTAKVGAYSSIVGGAVHIHENGHFAGQIAFLCQTNTLRDPAMQMAMSNLIAAALNQYFSSAEFGAMK